MDEAIRRQALRSAAKVAFGATLVWGAALSGCGGQSVGGTLVDDGSEGSDVGSTNGEGSDVGAPSGGTGAVAPDAGHEPELACNVSTAGLDAGILASADRATYACCAAYVATKLPADPLGAPNVPELTRDPAVVECCRYVNAAYDAFFNEPYPYAVNWFCCSPGVLPPAEYAGPFCTPWGPPVPPSLAVELGAAA